MCLLVLIGLYTAVDLVETTSWVSVSPGELLLLYPLKLPLAIAYGLPLTLLIGVLLTFDSLRRLGEWTGLMAGGVSPVHLVVGLTLTPCLGMVLNALLLATVVPAGLNRWQRAVSPASEAERAVPRWTRIDDRFVRRAPGEQTQLSIVRDRRGRPTQWSRTTQPSGGKERIWRSGQGWTLQPIEHLAEMPNPLAKVVRVSTQRSALPFGALGIGELIRGIELTIESGLDATPLRCALALRGALVFACLVLPLLGLSLGLLWRNGSTTSILATGIGAAAVYWIGLSIVWNGAVLALLSVNLLWWFNPVLLVVLIIGAIGLRIAPRVAWLGDRR